VEAVYGVRRVGQLRRHAVVEVGDPVAVGLGSVVDVCIGQQGQDLAVPGSRERELQIEGDFVPPP
jgi:hypothetical protein